MSQDRNAVSEFRSANLAALTAFVSYIWGICFERHLDKTNYWPKGYDDLGKIDTTIRKCILHGAYISSAIFFINHKLAEKLDNDNKPLSPEVNEVRVSSVQDRAYLPKAQHTASWVERTTPTFTTNNLVRAS